MSNKIILKKSSVTTKVPTPGDLDYGELALNYTDGKIYYKNSSNVIDSFTSAAGSSAVTSVDGNTGDVTATQLLTSIKTVDGSGSDLDADLLDGQQGSYYLDWTNTTNKPDPVVTVTLTGDVTGTANTTLTDLASGTVTVSTALAANSVALGTNTTGNYVAGATGGTGVTVTGSAGEGWSPTISIGQDVSTTSNVTFGDITSSGNVQIDGNLVVSGTTTTVIAENLAIHDNMIYLNNAIQTTITNAVGNGTTVVYTTSEPHYYDTGMTVSITGVDPSAYNLSNQLITAVTTNTFTVTNSATGTYVSGGTARAKVNSNPDLGWAAGRYDNGYGHAGVFRDASDGIFKFFDGYTPEPDISAFIDTAHASFALANVQAASFIGTLDGNATTATTLETARTINGVSFNGSANITIADSTKQPLDGDLTAIAALSGTSGLLKKTAADTWSLDTSTYVTSSGVTSVAGTGTVSGLTLTGTVTTTGNLTLGGTLEVTASNFASQTANTLLIAPNGSAGVPTFRALVSADIPTLNQNTTGTAANVTGIVAVSNGGTGGNTGGKALMSLNGGTINTNIGGTTTFTTTSGRIQIFNGSLSNTVKLPDCTTIISVGWQFEIINNSSVDMPVVSFDSSEVGTLPAGDVALVTRTTNTANNTAQFWDFAIITTSAATTSKLGLIKLEDSTVQSTAANAVTTTASRTYGLQVNGSGQGVVNVPWTDTVYSLPAATSTIRGGIELGSDTAQTVAANAVTATASRSYALQVNAEGQGVVNVPWTDTNSGGTVTSVGGTGTVSGLTLTGTVTTSGNLTLGGTLAVTASNFASQTANTILAAPNGTAGVPTFRSLVAADVPTLNQNTTGTAANVTGIVAVANGGTGTSTPSIGAGSNVTVTGTWPNQTINASGRSVFIKTTTNAAATALTTDGNAVTSNNQLVVLANSAYAFTGTVIARQQAAGGSNFAAWEIKGAILQNATTASTTLGTYNINVLSKTAGATSWNLTLSADTTNGSLAITATGAAGINIKWVATLQTSEVTYA